VRADIDRVRPGVVLLAEADDPALLARAFDIDYAWDFYHSMSDALTGRAPASTLRETWERAAAKYPTGALRLRFSDNHDQLRATAQAGLPAAMAASAVMFTLDGVPLLYNGMEVGDTTESAAPALFEKLPIVWDMSERRPQVAPYYRALAALRRAHPAFSRGAVRWLRTCDSRCAPSSDNVTSTPRASCGSGVRTTSPCSSSAARTRLIVGTLTASRRASSDRRSGPCSSTVTIADSCNGGTDSRPSIRIRRCSRPMTSRNRAASSVSPTSSRSVS